MVRIVCGRSCAHYFCLWTSPSSRSVGVGGTVDTVSLPPQIGVENGFNRLCFHCVTFGTHYVCFYITLSVRSVGGGRTVDTVSPPTGIGVVNGLNRLRFAYVMFGTHYCLYASLFIYHICWRLPPPSLPIRSLKWSKSFMFCFVYVWTYHYGLCWRVGTW